MCLSRVDASTGPSAVEKEGSFGQPISIEIGSGAAGLGEERAAWRVQSPRFLGVSSGAEGERAATGGAAEWAHRDLKPDTVASVETQGNASRGRVAGAGKVWRLW